MGQGGPAGLPSKRELRRSLLQQRQAISSQQWYRASNALCSQLQTNLLFQQALTVLAYFSTRQEPDLTALFVLKDKTWGLPRCQGQDLLWHECDPTDSTEVALGRFGIQEPRPDLPLIPAERVDLILVPAIACDYQGYRLGYGGGYYDRLLSQPEWRDKPAIGIVFQFAYLPALPIDVWDQPLRAVCTETGFFPVNS